MTMTVGQHIITIAMVVLGTMITRFLPFIIFPADKPTPKDVQYLGKALPPASLGLLVVYSLKDVNIFTGSRGIPELIAVITVLVIHLWKRQMLLSIAVGTITYMLWFNLYYDFLLLKTAPCRKPLKVELLVRITGFEPAQVAPHGPEPCASANSAISAGH